MGRRRPRIRVGDRVRFQFGLREATGVVVEDRGPVGVGGRQIVVVELDPGGESVRFEMPVADLTVIRAPRGRRHATS